MEEIPAVIEEAEQWEKHTCVEEQSPRVGRILKIKFFEKKLRMMLQQFEKKKRGLTIKRGKLDSLAKAGKTFASGVEKEAREKN